MLCVRTAAAPGDAHEESADGSKPPANGHRPAENADDFLPVRASTGRQVFCIISLA